MDELSDEQIAEIISKSSFKFMSFGMMVRSRGLILIKDSKLCSSNGIILGISEKILIDYDQFIKANPQKE